MSDLSELEVWKRAATVKQEWLDQIVDRLGMEKANGLAEVLARIDEVMYCARRWGLDK